MSTEIRQYFFETDFRDYLSQIGYIHAYVYQPQEYQLEKLNDMLVELLVTQIDSPPDICSYLEYCRLLSKIRDYFPEFDDIMDTKAYV